MSLKPFALIAPDACVVTCGYRLHSEIISRSHLLIRHISQYLNLMGGNPTVTSSLAPEERPAEEEAEQIIEHHDVPIDDNNDLPPLPTHPVP